MKTRLMTLSRTIVTMVVMFALFTIPAAAFELAMITGEQAPKSKEVRSAVITTKIDKNQTLRHVQPTQEIKDIFIIPQP